MRTLCCLSLISAPRTRVELDVLEGQFLSGSFSDYQVDVAWSHPLQQDKDAPGLRTARACSSCGAHAGTGRLETFVSAGESKDGIREFAPGGPRFTTRSQTASCSVAWCTRASLRRARATCVLPLVRVST